MELEYLHLFGEDDFVCAQFILHGTYTGDGAPNGGVRIALHYCVIDTIRDGLVQTETVYSNPQELLDQLETVGGETP